MQFFNNICESFDYGKESIYLNRLSISQFFWIIKNIFIIILFIISFFIIYYFITFFFPRIPSFYKILYIIYKYIINLDYSKIYICYTIFFISVLLFVGYITYNASLLIL